MDRTPQAGQDRAGRDTNTARKGRLKGQSSHSLDWVPTLAAKGNEALQAEHLRFKRQPIGANTLHCVLLDMSASMLRGQKLAWAKGCLLALTAQFYRRREHMAVIGFAGTQAKVLQVPGKVATFNEAWIAPLQGGGGTPIASAIDLANAMLRKHKETKSGAVTTVWLLTDGRFDPLPAKSEFSDICHILDFENEDLALHRCSRLADVWNAQLINGRELCTAS